MRFRRRSRFNRRRRRGLLMRGRRKRIRRTSMINRGGLEITG
ncbi:hypothetical protein [Peromfec virus RodF8_60]|uniref:Uncharacterized protein n=1 Tax=Peromfec virus RodF8_60 TaxID=2929386 RepID=A0A976R8R4_9VIRU|nr:hypothetical protein [Peromfec virus RodF8_60]